MRVGGDGTLFLGERFRVPESRKDVGQFLYQNGVLWGILGYRAYMF